MLFALVFQILELIHRMLVLVSEVFISARNKIIEKTSLSAMVNIKKGDTILSSKPFVHILCCEFRGRHCNFCLKRPNCGSNLCRCSKCGFYYYCNKTCQKSDWPLHKHECKKLKRLPGYPELNDVFILSRILIKLQECNGAEEYETVGPYTRKFEDLESHVEELKKDKLLMKKAFERYDILIKYLGEKNVPPFYSVLEIVGKILVNAISIEDADTLTVIGNGLFLGSSILDHSCEADAEFSFRGTTVFVRSIKDLPHHDIKQVHISYADRMEPIEVRQKFLNEKYFFTCTCNRCSNPEVERFLSEVLDPMKANDVIYRSRALLNMLDVMYINGESPINLSKLAENCLKDQDGILGEKHVLRVKMKIKLMDFCMMTLKWKEAAKLGVEVLDPIKQSYGPFSHQMATRLFGTASAQLHSKNIKEAKKTLCWAEKVMRVAFGDEHKTYKELVAVQNMISFMESKDINSI